MWRAEAYFPCCPKDFGSDPIQDYFNNLNNGDVFAYSNYEELFPSLSVAKSRILMKESSILVLCEREDQRYSMVGIKLDDKSKYFIHFGLGLFSSKCDAIKAYYEKGELTDFWSEGYDNINC